MAQGGLLDKYNNIIIRHLSAEAFNKTFLKVFGNNI
jgi:hypothetical protein